MADRGAGKWGERRDQGACKPGSVTVFPSRKHRDDHSSRVPLARHLMRPTRMRVQKRTCSRERCIPIRSCSRWGLPCPLPCGRGGGLLPHRFTLTAPGAAVCFLRRYPLIDPVDPPGFPRHLASVEPGLSSPAGFPHLQQRPSSPLTSGYKPRRRGQGQDSIV